MKISIRNFQGIDHLDLDLNAGLTVVAGHNGAGKSSIRDAIAFAIFRSPGRVALVKEFGRLVRAGAKSGSVSVGGLTRTLPDGKAQGEALDDAQEVLGITLGVHRYEDLSDAERRVVVASATSVEITPDVIMERLADRGISDEFVRPIVPHLSAGQYDEAAGYCKRMASEARGEWKGITGETYGPKKAETWCATEDVGIPGIDVDACDRRISEIDELIEAAPQRLAEVDGADGGLCCPACGASLRIENADVDRGHDIGMLTAERDQLRDARSQELEARERASAAERAEAAHRAVQAWTHLASLVAPDGIPGELAESAVDELNTSLASSPWAVRINSDWGLEFRGRPYRLLSRSEQWRCDAAMQVAIARLSGTQLTIMDEFDVLDAPSRKEAHEWLSQTDTRVLLLGTLSKKLAQAIGAIWLGAKS